MTLRRIDTWNGITTGAPVKVTHVRGMFTFQGAYADESGRVESIQVMGTTGRSGRNRVFEPERIIPLNTRGIQ